MARSKSILKMVLRKLPHGRLPPSLTLKPTLNPNPGGNIFEGGPSGGSFPVTIKIKRKIIKNLTLYRFNSEKMQKVDLN